MWRCEKCGREFKKQNQSHFCGQPAKTIDEYIAEQPEIRQAYLNQIRNTLRAALPDASERISWTMPTYWNKRNIIHFSAFQNHIGLYIGERAMAHFSERLKEYKITKSAVHLSYDKPLPISLITEIAQWCDSQNDHL